MYLQESSMPLHLKREFFNKKALWSDYYFLSSFPPSWNREDKIDLRVFFPLGKITACEGRVVFCVVILFYKESLKYKVFKIKVLKFLAFIFLPLLIIDKLCDILSVSLSLIGFSASKSFPFGKFQAKNQTMFFLSHEFPKPTSCPVSIWKEFPVYLSVYLLSNLFSRYQYTYCLNQLKKRHKTECADNEKVFLSSGFPLSG